MPERAVSGNLAVSLDPPWGIGSGLFLIFLAPRGVIKEVEIVKIALATRFKIVGVEVVGFGAFLLVELVLSLRQAQNPALFQAFSYDYALIGAVLIAVGLEILSLIRHLPTGKIENTS